MYVCICHGFTDREIQEAKLSGANSQTKIFDHFGVAPKCGKCINAVDEILGAPKALTRSCHDGKATDQTSDALADSPGHLKKSS